MRNGAHAALTDESGITLSFDQYRNGLGFGS